MYDAGRPGNSILTSPGVLSPTGSGPTALIIFPVVKSSLMKKVSLICGGVHSEEVYYEN